MILEHIQYNLGSDTSKNQVKLIEHISNNLWNLW